MSEVTKKIEEMEAALFTADHCLSCTSCMSSCPVMEAEKKYLGPKMVGPAHRRMQFSQDDIEECLDFCSNCKSCERACPSGVAVSTLNMLQRAKYYETHAHSHCDDMLAHGERMAKRVRMLPGGPVIANLGMRIGKAMGVFGALGMAGERSIPPYAPKSFLQLFKDIRQPRSEKKVVFFPGCFINDNDPQVGVAFVKVMNANGYEVLVDEEFNCCGSPLVFMGYLAEAHEHADNNVAHIMKWQAQGIPVVACCASCSLMLKQEYHELFDDSKMQAAGRNVYDAFEFLEILAEKDELNTDFQPVEEKLLYHVPCHLKSQGLGVPAARILAQVPGVAVEQADAGCCGMSGNYGFKGDKYAISMKIGEKLFNRIKDADSDEVICDCGTCRLQIQHGTQAKTCHPVQILAKAYGL